MKCCSKCKRNLSSNYFSKNKTMKGDYSWWCKDCMKIIKNKWHIKNIEYHRFLNKKYYAEDPERRKRSKRNWLNKRPEYLAIQKAIRRSREYKSQGSFSEEEW